MSLACDTILNLPYPQHSWGIRRAGQSSGSEQNRVSDIDAPTNTPELEDMPDDSFSKEDYQKLLALQFDDYQHMTVSEFQNKVSQISSGIIPAICIPLGSTEAHKSTSFPIHCGPFLFPAQ